MQRACKSKGRFSSSKTKKQILIQAKSCKTDAPPIMVKIKLDDCVVDMEVDTVLLSP